MARKMVCEWGMSDALGPLTYGKKEEAIFLGKEFNRHQDYSEATALKIDAEIKRLVVVQYERATALLTEKRPELVRAANALLEYEVLDAQHIRQILAGEELKFTAPKQPDQPPAEETKAEDPGQAGGILPPPVAAPKPTS
jgi:cell division protease FtsH